MFFMKKGHTSVILAAALVVIALLLAFRAGMAVGFHKAAFSFRGGEGFYRGFEGRQSARPGMAARDEFTPAHGASGTIVSVAPSYFVVLGPDQFEKTVAVSSTTVMSRFRSKATLSDIKPGDFATVLGDPDEEGRIVARFVRLAPALSTTGTSTPR
jgi:hypothetical protein